MKILLCTNAFSQVTNGPAKFAQLILDINRSNTGNEVAILTEDTPKESDHVFSIKPAIPQLLKPAGMFLRMWQYHRRAMQLKNSSFPFDILVYNNAIVSLRSALTYKPVVGFINDDNNASVSWRAGLFRFAWSRKHIFFLNEWLATRWCSAIVVNSEYLRQYVIQRYRADPAKIVRLYKAIDMPIAPIERHNPEPVILFVKNDYVRGGLFTLLEAIRQMNRPLLLQVVGPPEYARNEIESLASQFGVRIEFLGIQPQEAVFDLMRKADIFCVPSHQEALGVANMEALACGCAVVSSTAGGIPEVLEHGQHGWLVAPGDAEALAQALAEAMDNTNLRTQKTTSGQMSLNRFNKTVLLNNFLQIMQPYAS